MIGSLQLAFPGVKLIYNTLCV